MRQVNPTMQNLARRLLMQEPDAVPDAAALSETMARVCDQLRFHVATLMGTDGFTVLLVRALTFSRADFPGLEVVRVERDGSLTGLDTVAQREPAQAGAAFTAVLTHFLGLLAAFIGDHLTLRVLRGVWPDVDLSGSDTGLEEAI